MILMPISLSEIPFYLILTSFVMLLFWVRQIKTQNANAVDAVWAFSFTICVIFLVLNKDIYFWSAKSWVILILVTLWSLRLSGYLYWTRIITKKPEDPRYHRLRKDLGWGQVSFFVLYQVQALIVGAMFVSVLNVVLENRTAVWTDYLGIGLMVAGIIGETVADLQLKKFISNPANKGKTCQVGLWNYSRHPNYFFEWLFWSSFVAFSLNVEYPWITLVAPAVISYLLVFVGGVAATERHAARSRHGYLEYQQTTSCFVPWFKLQKNKFCS